MWAGGRCHNSLSSGCFGQLSLWWRASSPQSRFQWNRQECLLLAVPLITMGNLMIQDVVLPHLQNQCPLSSLGQWCPLSPEYLDGYRGSLWTRWCSVLQSCGQQTLLRLPHTLRRIFHGTPRRCVRHHCWYACQENQYPMSDVQQSVRMHTSVLHLSGRSSHGNESVRYGTIGVPENIWSEWSGRTHPSAWLHWAALPGWTFQDFWFHS